MNNPTFATLNQTKPTRKTLIYLPDLKDFSRGLMDKTYRHAIQQNLAHGMKYTLPANHLHLQLCFDESDLWDETINAVKDYEGYLVLTMVYPEHHWWESGRGIGQIDTKPMECANALKENLQKLMKLLYDENFKPKHIVLAGKWKCEMVSFINHIMLVECVPALTQIRGSAIAPETKEKTK